MYTKNAKKFLPLPRWRGEKPSDIYSKKGLQMYNLYNQLQNKQGSY